MERPVARRLRRLHVILRAVLELIAEAVQRVAHGIERRMMRVLVGARAEHDNRNPSTSLTAFVLAEPSIFRNAEAAVLTLASTTNRRSTRTMGGNTSAVSDSVNVRCIFREKFR